MKFRLAVAAAALLLGACQPSTAPAKDVNGIAAVPAAGQPPEGAPSVDGAPGASAANQGCDAKAESQWGPIGPSDHPSYHVDAYTLGPVCESSVATLVIRARDGFPIYVFAAASQDLFGLADAKNSKGMTAALIDWTQQNDQLATTGKLPAWEETDGQPKRAEFPFMPESWIDKATYNQLRKDNLPMFCFPQGKESLRCAALHPGEANSPASLDDIGLQLFPG